MKVLRISLGAKPQTKSSSFHIPWNALVGARYWVLGFSWLGYFIVLILQARMGIQPRARGFLFPTPTQSANYIPQNSTIPTSHDIFPIALSTLYSMPSQAVFSRMNCPSSSLLVDPNSSQTKFNCQLRICSAGQKKWALTKNIRSKSNTSAINQATHSLRIHEWNIYLHLPYKSTKCR